MAVRFVAVGELLVDVLAEGAGHDARIRLSPAGSSFNAAVAAARAGADAAVIGTVGGDPAGRMILTELAERGVRAEVTVADGPTGTFLMADSQIRVDRGVSHDLVLPARIDADVVLVSGYVAAAREALAAKAKWVAFDAGGAEDVPAEADIVFAGDRDVHRLAKGRRLAVVTFGAEGAAAVMGETVVRARPGRNAKDAPGSGDVFAATLLVELARGHALADAMEVATQAAVDSLM